MKHLELLHDHHLLVAGIAAVLTIALAAAMIFAVSYCRRPASMAALLRAGNRSWPFRADRRGADRGRGFGTPPDAEREMIIVIPDIKGYTNFISFSGQSLGHAQHVVSELLTAIVEAAADVLRMSLPEGDAILLYSTALGRAGDGDKVAASILNILVAFYRRKEELIAQTTCACNACTGLPNLEIKVVVHRGEVYQSQTAGIQQLVGYPVIVAHRLLKNSVSSRRYVLLTREAAAAVELPLATGGRRNVETYDDLGRIETRVYEFELDDLTVAAAHVS